MKPTHPLFLSTVLIVFSISLFSQNFDIDILKKINSHESSFKTKYLELNASSVTALGVGIPACIAITGFINHDKKLQKDGFFMGIAFIGSSIITQSVKRIIDRQRPFEKYAFIIKRDDESGGLSFPSGHSSEAFCTATNVALRYRKWYFVAPSYLFATSVAWARMYQGVHYPSDVLAGALVGSGSAWLSWKLQKWMERKNNLKKQSNGK
jgi:membrane-associated phospholipid phosphatase